jgi:hypothetical protein
MGGPSPLGVRRIVIAAVAALLVAGSVIAVRTIVGRRGGNEPPLASSAVNPPPTGAWFGSWVGARYGSSRDERQRAIEELETKLGRKLAIDHTFVPWQTKIGWQPAWDVSQGRIPLISFGFGGDTREVAAGRHDAYLRSLVSEVRALDHPVMLRYAFEMDGLGNDRWVHTGPDYVAAWRHVHDLFEGLPVAWVWAPNAVAWDNRPRVESFWPGDDYVDWIGADGYNFYGCRDRTDWRGFGEIFKKFYKWGSKRGKPLIIPETGSTEDAANPARKRDWYVDAGAALRSMPRVRAVVFFDSSNPCPWWVDTSQQSLDGFRTLAGQASLSSLPAPGE